MLTGFWPPSNEMLRKFSTDPNQNPGGWQGQNWEGRGYDVYAYFPEFPGGVGGNPKGNGDFEVDYQDVSSDFWRITGNIHPVAILSYGKGSMWWEIEYNARNLSAWCNDYLSPLQPTPFPPDGSVPADSIRNSTLPVQAIADAINNSGIGVNAFVDWDGDPGAFLCEYMAYHDAWYKSLHSDPSDQYLCLAAGFTHVPAGLSVSTATTVCEVALRATIDYLDSQLTSYTISGTVTLDGLPLAGAVMNGLPGNPVTDAGGFYTAQVGAGWSGAVSPVKEGYAFNPAERIYSNVIANQPAQNCVGSAAASQIIEFDAASSDAASSDNTTLSWAHTIGGGNNRILVVSAICADSVAKDEVISSIKYNGVNMTPVPASGKSRGYIKADLYYMLEADLPSVPGTYTVSITYNGAVYARAGGAVSLRNVKQQGPETVVTNSLASAAAISTNISTLSNGDWIVDAAGHACTGSFSTSTSAERWDRGVYHTAAGSTTVAASAGANNVSWNFSGNNGAIVHSLAAFAPAQTAILEQLPSDNFDNNKQDSAAWRLYTENSEKVWLVEDANRLNIRAAGGVNTFVADYTANEWSIDVGENFQTKVDFHYSPVSATAGWVKMAIENGSNNYILIAADSNNNEPHFWFEQIVDGSTVSSGQIARDLNDGTLFISYDAVLDELYLSHTGYGSANAWQTIAGLLRNQWASNPVTVAIGGGSKGCSIGDGQAYLDNFEVTSGRVLGWPTTRDLNRDGFIDSLDIKIMSEHWLQTGIGIEGDVNGDDTVNFVDFAFLTVAG
jgi:hypothetical protein